MLRLFQFEQVEKPNKQVENNPNKNKEGRRKYFTYFLCENIVPMIIEDIKSSLTVDKIKRENLKYEAT